MSDSTSTVFMTDHELQSLAAEWVRYWRAPEGSQQKESLFWVNEREWDLVVNAPLEAWRLILEVLELDSSPGIQEVLSAGPLEDLLSKHGAVVIDKVEEKARTSAVFASLLGGCGKTTCLMQYGQEFNRSGTDAGGMAFRSAPADSYAAFGK